MDDMKIFLINLDKQEQDTGRAWFTPPCEIEEMKETIGLSADSERYLISAFSLPFEITDSVDLSIINEVCISIAGNDFPYEDIRFLQKAWFPTLSELRNGLDEVTRYEKYGTDKTRNQQGTSRRYQLCCGVHSVGFVYCLRSRLHQEDK